MNRLLPPNSTALEHALTESADETRLAPEIIAALWDAAACPAANLPWLAWALSVDTWDGAWSEAIQRAVIAASIDIHRKKGTVWAVQKALEAIGYPDCEILEHSALMQEWLAADGEFLDGVGVLDGDSDLSAPGGNFRFMSTQWAEYALRLNTVGGPSDASELRKIAQACAAVAPVRSHLIAILLFLAFTIEAIPYRVGYTERGRVTLRDCRRITVPRFDTLDGCDLIGGGYEPDTLDGIGVLDGYGDLMPQRAIGEPLDGGQLDIRIPHSRTRLCGTALGGSRLEPPETLDSADFLDGHYTIAGECLDGYGALDGGSLYYPTLADPEDTLDGASNLGCIPGPDHLWFTGLTRTRRGSTTTQEPL
jgi:phage tail P2-like protein